MKSETREEAKTDLQMQLTDKKQSALKKYQMMTIGKKGLWRLMKYEIIITCFSWVPGAMGFLLRKIFYPKLFARVGRGSVFGRNITIRHPHKIRIVERCIIFLFRLFYLLERSGRVYC